jgi:hypothetical protein
MQWLLQPAKLVCQQSLEELLPVGLAALLKPAHQRTSHGEGTSVLDFPLAASSILTVAAQFLELLLLVSQMQL